MSSSKPAVPERKKWDKDEWAAKAKDRDAEAVDRAKEAEKAMAAGKKYRPKEDLPKPTELMKQRTENLGLDKGIGKTTLVTTTPGVSGAHGGGFYCEACNRTFKDSLSYLDHINGRIHLQKLGQTTNVERSTVAQVRERIRQLREQSKTRVEAKNFDFAKRLAEVRAADSEEKERRKEERKRKRAERREAEAAEDERRRGKRAKKDEVGGGVGGGRGGGGGGGGARAEVGAGGEEEDMAMMMGFGGFGTSKKR